MCHYGNKLADKLAKETAAKNIVTYNRISMCETAQQLREMSLKKWQMQLAELQKRLQQKSSFQI